MTQPSSADGSERERQRRRWPWVAGGAVVLLAVAAAGFWFLFVPNWRPPLRDGERYGVDVSKHQGEIDWRAVADDGIDFAYIKATEGGDFTDARFEANWNAAGRVGLDRGAYHFFTLCRPGRDQARHFLSVVEPSASALPPAVDLELAGNCTRRPSSDDVDAELRAFLEVVGRRGIAQSSCTSATIGTIVTRSGMNWIARSGTSGSCGVRTSMAGSSGRSTVSPTWTVSSATST